MYLKKLLRLVWPGPMHLPSFLHNFPASKLDAPERDSGFCSGADFKVYEASVCT